MKRHKKYAKVRCKETGKWLLLHRKVMAEHLGRSLLPGEIVHHLDGDSTNNDPSNLMILPNQRHHAHIEYHQRRAKRGMPTLFPELFGVLQEVTSSREERRGTLFEHLLLQR